MKPQSPSAPAHPNDTHAEEDRATPRLLFVEPDIEFGARLLQDRKAALVPPLIVAVGSAAMEILANHEIELCGVYVSQHVSSPDSYSVIRKARLIRPMLPIYLTYTDADCPVDPDALRKLGVTGAVPRTFTYGEIARKFFSPAMLFEPSDALTGASLDPTPEGHEHHGSDEDFMPIRADSFMSGSKSLFDVYVRLHAGKYLKILKANDDFSSDRLDSYLKKGLANFYIHKVSQDAYLAYSQKLGAAVVKHPSISPETKLGQTLSHGDNVVGFLKQNQIIEPEQLVFAESYVNMVYALVYELGLDKQEGLVKALLDNSRLKDHNVGTIILGGVIARNLDFETKKSVVTIGLACLLHDIGIFNDQDGLELIDEREMTDEQRETYLAHPVQGAKILDGIHGLNPAIPEIVANHHRRRNGTGFPSVSGITVTKVSVPMEIVGMADELLRLFMSHVGQTRQSVENYLVHTVFPAFSPEVVEAVKKALRMEL